MLKTPESKAKSFLFRDLDSSTLVGIASDPYGGWIGQIYSEGRYEKGEDKIQVNLIINNRAGGNVPLIAQKIAARLHNERQQRLF